MRDTGDSFHEYYDGERGSIPEEYAAKEEIYENLMDGRISTLDEKLAALG